MAILVVRRTDHRKEDGTVNLQRARRGEVLDILEDGHVWGSKEPLAAWKVIELPGVPRAHVERLVRPWLDEEASGAIDGAKAEQLRAISRSRRRAYRLSLTRLAFLESRPILWAAILKKLRDGPNWTDADLSQLFVRFDAAAD